MRILVLSDSHGDAYAVYRCVQAQPSAEVIIHLGDGEDDLALSRQEFPQKKFIQVCGNCDWGSLLPAQGMDLFEGKRVLYTHGHLEQVKMGSAFLLQKAHNANADIVLFGHTHLPLTDYQDGLYILNPGSVSGRGSGKPTYGYIDITPAGIVCHIVNGEKHG